MDYLLSVYCNSPIYLAFIWGHSSHFNWWMDQYGTALSRKSDATVKEILWGEGILACSSQCSAVGRSDAPSVPPLASHVPAWGHLPCSFLCGGLREQHSLEMGKLRVLLLNLITILEKFFKKDKDSLWFCITLILYNILINFLPLVL